MATYAPSKDTTSDGEKYMWDALYPWLLPRVKRWVTNSGVVIWTKQTDDVASDITQEAITRVFRTTVNAEHGQAPIASLKAFSLIVARNHFKDLRRKEARLLHFNPSPSPVNEQSEQNLVMHFAAEDTIGRMIDYLFVQEIMVMIANIIADLPAQQQEALLVTLAADLPTQLTGTEPLTLLQQALASHGLQLQNYQYGKPVDECLRRRFAANLHAAKLQVARRYHAMAEAQHDRAS